MESGISDEYARYPVDGVLDLHMFKPREVTSVLEEYLTECRRRGILRVRIIHGKGQGVLRRLVQSRLREHPSVREFTTASDVSGWGATIAVLDPTPENPERGIHTRD